MTKYSFVAELIRIFESFDDFSTVNWKRNKNEPFLLAAKPIDLRVKNMKFEEGKEQVRSAEDHTISNLWSF